MLSFWQVEGCLSTILWYQRSFWTMWNQKRFTKTSDLSILAMFTYLIYIFFDHMVDIKALLNTQASYKLDFFSPILCSWVMIFAVKLHFFSNLPHQFDFQHTIFQLWVNVCESYWYNKYFLKVDDLSQSSFLSTSIFFGFSDYFLQRCIFVPHLYHNVLTVVRIMTTTKKKIRLLHKICCEFFYFY